MPRLGALALATLLAACAAPAPPPVRLEAAPVAPPAPRQLPRQLYVVGLAMQSQTWSYNDVYRLAEKLGTVANGFTDHPVLFSSDDPPPATGIRNVGPALAQIAASLAPDDVVLVYASTHGAPGLLGNQENGHDTAPVTTEDLRQWLEPLRGHDTILILSACFSASFIPALEEDHRIIFTAARADRTSFGCQAGARHTVFGEALLDALAPNTSLHTVVDQTRRAVTAREHALGITAPSLPQIFVGPQAEHLYEAPIF